MRSRMSCLGAVLLSAAIAAAQGARTAPRFYPDDPLLIDRDIAEGTGELVIAKVGYQDVTKQIRLDSEVTLDIELDRKVVAETRRPDKKPADKKPADKKPDKKPPVSKGSDSTKGDPTLDIRLSR